MPENPARTVAIRQRAEHPGVRAARGAAACDELLDGHGGHAAAAGFKVRPDRIDGFRDRFNAYVADHFPGGTARPAARARRRGAALGADVRADEGPRQAGTLRGGEPEAEVPGRRAEGRERRD